MGSTALPLFFHEHPITHLPPMTIPKSADELSVVSIWSKINTKERDALKAVANEREQTISQVIKWSLKQHGFLG